MKFSKRKILLALETALNGGSVSVFDNYKRIDGIKGSGKLSKSEDILLLIEDLLTRNSIRKSEIKLITVSDGPGSLTGIRIGLSIAKGLADSLAIEVLKVSILDALAKQYDLTGRVIIGIGTEKMGIYYREYFFRESYHPEALGELSNLRLAYFIEKINLLRGEKISFVFSGELESVLKSSDLGMETLEGIKYCVIQGEMADIIGRTSTELIP